VTDNHNRDRALLDELSAVVPQADPAFRDRLEAQLLAQLQERALHTPEEEISAMQHALMYPHSVPQEANHSLRSVAAPLTLAAALLMVILAGSALLFMGQPDSGADPLAAAQQQTATPIPTACPPLLNWTERYTVQPGDTLLGVIVRHGVDARLFLEANCLDENSRLIPGQTVYLPLPIEEPSAISPAPAVSLLTPTPIGADALPLQIPLPPTVQAPSASAAVTDAIVVTLEATIAAPAGYVPVVIAAQDIARGAVITPDMLAVVYWPLDLYQAAISSLGADVEDLYSAVEQIAGLYANADIPRFQPVLVADLAPQQP